MGLHNFSPSPGSSTKKRRIARGIGSGMGKTATRGTKGQKARRQIHPNFEGGQTPSFRRIPVKKGFRNPNSKTFAIVNLDDLQKHYEVGEEVNAETLTAKGIIDLNRMDGVKILAFGELSKKLIVRAHKFSAAAAEAITKSGGEAHTL